MDMEGQTTWSLEMYGMRMRDSGLGTVLGYGLALAQLQTILYEGEAVDNGVAQKARQHITLITPTRTQLHPTLHDTQQMVLVCRCM